MMTDTCCRIKEGEADAMREHIASLEIAIRAALSFVQERFSDRGTYSDGHAQMVAMALRGALRKGREQRDD